MAMAGEVRKKGCPPRVVPPRLREHAKPIARRPQAAGRALWPARAKLSENGKGAAIPMDAPGAVPKSSHVAAFAGATARRFFASVSKSATLAGIPKAISWGTVPKALGAVSKASQPFPGAAKKATHPLPPWRKKTPLPVAPPPKAVVACCDSVAREPAPAQAEIKAPPPWRRRAPLAATPGESDKDDDSDYDPFTEEPAPHVAEEKASCSTAAVHSASAVPQALADNTPFSAELTDLVKAAREESRRSLTSIQVITAHIATSRPTAVLPEDCAAAASKAPPPWRGQQEPRAGSTQTSVACEATQPPAQAEPFTGAQAEMSAGGPAPEPAKAPATAPELAGGPDAATVAASWLQRGAGAVPRRMRAGAALAQEYFVHTGKELETPARKRPRLEHANFVPELLQKAPSSLQTCRSLLLFLEKKLEPPGPAAPNVGGPKDLRTRLELHADSAGRLAGLEQPGGWDARARRVLDLGSYAKASGEAALSVARKQLEASAAELEKELRERGEEGLEALTGSRRSWAQDSLRRSWLAWCARLLRAREVALLAEAQGRPCSGPSGAGTGGEAAALDTAAIFEALLAGQGGA